MSASPPPGTDYIALLNAALPLITNLAPLFAQAIAAISAQSGKAVDTTIGEIYPQLDANEVKLLADIVKEQNAIAGGAA